MIKKIVIIGPESTGKSMLCSMLANHYKTRWCPEYAREFLLKNGTNYSYADLLTIAKGQIALEEEYIEKLKQLSISPSETRSSIPFFIDTDMYVMKVWCEFVFGKCHPFILKNIVDRQYDFYLLCNTDIAWVKDELREYPDLETRSTLFKNYKDILINQPVPWIEIYGNNYQERFRQAVSAVDALL